MDCECIFSSHCATGPGASCTRDRISWGLLAADITNLDSKPDLAQFFPYRRFFFFFLAQKNPRWRPSFFLTSLDWQVEIFIPPSLKRAAFCIQALVGAGVTELVLCLQELRASAPAPAWAPIPDYTHEVPVPWEPLLITKPHPWGRPPSQHVSRGSGLHSCFNFCHLVISHSLVRELSCILIFLF